MVPMTRGLSASDTSESSKVLKPELQKAETAWNKA
jgi:hypothetical protein